MKHGVIWPETGCKGKNKKLVKGALMGEKAHVIVVGNEKGGSGKTTTAMHIVTALVRMGFQVGTIDVDTRQRTLSRYVENRRRTSEKKHLDLPMPVHFIGVRSKASILDEAEREEKEEFAKTMHEAGNGRDFVVVDSPGSDTYLSRVAHSYADTVITPINDSFLDLDVLANVDSDGFKVIRPSIYSEMVFQQKIARAGRDGGIMDWIVIRNRMGSVVSKNKKNIEKVLNELSRRVAFRTMPGFNERVIYRELFLDGLTVLDVLEKRAGVNVSMSHLAARIEVRNLLRALNIAKINERLGLEADQQKQQEVLTAQLQKSIAERAAQIHAVQDHLERV